MNLSITWKYLLAFIALNMIAGELHEQVHINTGYLICGCYGTRDFNVWNTCAQCNHPAWAFLATLAGPLFSCSLMWLGTCMFLKCSRLSGKSIGFSILFANLPFARIFTALTGRGDEKVVLQTLLGDDGNMITIKLLNVLLVSLICLPPIILVFKKLDRTNRWWVITGFSVLPLIFGMLYQRMLLNQLLQNGFGADIFMIGTPNIILFHFILMLMILYRFRKSIPGLLVK
jgi:hypothetical protein